MKFKGFYQLTSCISSYALVPLGLIFGVFWGIIWGWQAFYPIFGGSWGGLAVLGYAALMALPLAGLLALIGLPFLTVWLCCSFVTLLFYPMKV